MAVVPAPGGWGFVPGTNIADVETGDLPELPLLALFKTPRERMRVLREAATSFPRGTTIQHVQERYALPYYAAFAVLHRGVRPSLQK